MPKPNPNTPYTTSYRNIRYPRLEYKTGTLMLILPKNYKNENQLLEKHQKWIQQKHQAIQNALNEAKTRQLNKRNEEQLKTLTHQTVDKYKTELKAKTNRIIFRKMKTKWASYSKNQNLTINTLTRHLPTNLIEYIIYHELTHAKERKHNNTFWKHISKKHPDHQTKEKDLLAYWFLIQQQQ